MNTSCLGNVIPKSSHYNWVTRLHKAVSKQVLNQQCNLAIENDIDKSIFLLRTWNEKNVDPILYQETRVYQRAVISATELETSFGDWSLRGQNDPF